MYYFQDKFFYNTLYTSIDYRYYGGDKMEKNYFCSTCGGYLNDADAEQHCLDGHDVILDY